MAKIHRITVSPGQLDLHGGPRSQPFGTLVAELTDEAGRSVEAGSLDWSSSNPDFLLEKDKRDPRRVVVGSHSPGTATVTVRDSASGKSASAVVRVTMLDAGMR